LGWFLPDVATSEVVNFIKFEQGLSVSPVVGSAVEPAAMWLRPMRQATLVAVAMGASRVLKVLALFQLHASHPPPARSDRGPHMRQSQTAIIQTIVLNAQDLNANSTPDVPCARRRSEQAIPDVAARSLPRPKNFNDQQTLQRADLV
jgi:hypothetical protein